MRIFNAESPLMEGLSKVADLVILNLLVLLCCIPVITAGAALTGMHYVLLKMARDYGKTIIIVTHNQNIAKMADVVIHIRSGKVTSVKEQLHPLSAEGGEW